MTQINVNQRPTGRMGRINGIFGKLPHAAVTRKSFGNERFAALSALVCFSTWRKARP
jgi:hypothetical protein